MSKRKATAHPLVLCDTGLHKLGQKWFHNLVDDAIQNKITLGIDEVGRGCVYGPVVVAGVAIINDWHIAGIKDSKIIKSEPVRRALAYEIQHNTVWATASIDAVKLNQLTSQWVEGKPKPMTQIINECGQAIMDAIIPKLRDNFPGRHIDVVFDGDDWEPKQCSGYTIKCFPKADATVYEVSSASILAKVLRDNWVHEQVKADPSLGRYDLDNCKGYGTAKHKAALMEFGLTDHHRKAACATLLTPR